MKVIALIGSPRKGGNTELLLSEAIKGIEDSGFSVEVFSLNSMNILPCQGCSGCDETGICIYDDDMTKIYEAIREADRVILASPIFFFALSAQTKIMIDRCQSFWCEKYLLKKPVPAGKEGRKGLLLMVGGMKNEKEFQCSELTAKAFFRTISVSEHTTISISGVDNKGAILSHPTAMTDAYEAGKLLVKGDNN